MKNSVGIPSVGVGEKKVYQGKQDKKNDEQTY